MSSINPGGGPLPITSSVAGISSSEKNSSAEKTASADAAAAKTVQSANAEIQGLAGSEKSQDRDPDGRQLYEGQDDKPASQTSESSEPSDSAARSTDPQKLRGTRLDLDA